MIFGFQCMMAMCIQQMSLLILVGAQYCSAANIIIFVLPAYSHVMGPANVAKVLQDQDHNVVIAIPSHMQDTFKQKGLNMLVYHSLGDLNVMNEIERVVSESFFNGTSHAIEYNFLKIWKGMSEKILRDQQLLDDIRSHRPDLIILDPTVPARLLTIIAYKLDIPFMFMGLGNHPQYSRTPLLPSAVPLRFFDNTDQMTFRQRFSNTLVEFMLYFYDPCSYPDIRVYAPEKPYISMQDLQAKALLWLVTQDGVLDYNAPTMPNVKPISHLLTVTPKPLPHEFQFFMDNAKDGVVIVSFGSIFKSMPPVIMDKFLRAFKRTKYNFVIRHSMSNYSDPDKVLVRNWLPQYDLLCHKNTRLFITHCGLNGQQESILAGVPMIGFPTFAEQPHNAARAVRKGFGLRLDLRSFSVEELVAAIEEVITNPEYKRRTKKAAAIMRARILPPVEEAAFWINHILTFGADHLRSLGQDLPLWQYLGLDVLLVCLLVFHFLGFIIIKLLSLCIFFGADHLRSLGQDLPLWQYLGLDVLLVCLLVCNILGFIFIKMLSLCIFWCFKRKEKIKKQ